MVEIRWDVIPNYLGDFVHGLEMTLFISVVCIILGFFGGLIVGMCRISKNPVIYYTSTAYVEAFRCTPLLIQIFMVYLGLSQLGFQIDSALEAGMIALSLNSAAYQAEIFRGGVQAISKGQMEASRSLGLSYNQSLLSIVIPQALRNALPPYTNEFITMIKDSSLVMAIGVLELTQTGKIVSAHSAQPFAVLTFVALLYFILCFSTSRILAYVEKKFRIPGMMGE